MYMYNTLYSIQISDASLLYRGPGRGLCHHFLYADSGRLLAVRSHEGNFPAWYTLTLLIDIFRWYGLASSHLHLYDNAYTVPDIRCDQGNLRAATMHVESCHFVLVFEFCSHTCTLFLGRQEFIIISIFHCFWIFVFSLLFTVRIDEFILICLNYDNAVIFCLNDTTM